MYMAANLLFLPMTGGVAMGQSPSDPVANTNQNTVNTRTNKDCNKLPCKNSRTSMETKTIGITRGAAMSSSSNDRPVVPPVSEKELQAAEVTSPKLVADYRKGNNFLAEITNSGKISVKQMAQACAENPDLLQFIRRDATIEPLASGEMLLANVVKMSPKQLGEIITAYEHNHEDGLATYRKAAASLVRPGTPKAKIAQSYTVIYGF